MKKIIMKFLWIFCLLNIFFFNSCKKNDSPLPENNINPVGVWSLVSSNMQQNNNSAPTYTSIDYPCLSNNKTYINSDGTSKGKYVGTDTCYVFHTSSASISIGTPGDSINGTWSQSGNTIFLHIRGTISSGHLTTVNGVSQLVERDTLSYMNTIITTIYKK